MADSERIDSSSLHTLVGRRVKTTLQPGGEEFQADLFALDSANNVVIFREQHTHTFQKADYRIVSINALAGVPEDLGASQSVMPSIRDISDAEVKRREEEAAFRERERLNTRGVGVTPEAQSIFDFINKTMRCRWDNKNIVVSEKIVVVADTFTVCYVQGSSSEHYSGMRDRVTQMVTKAREVVKSRGDADSPTGTAAGAKSAPEATAASASNNNGTPQSRSSNKGLATKNQWAALAQPAQQ